MPDDPHSNSVSNVASEAKQCASPIPYASCATRAKTTLVFFGLIIVFSAIGSALSVQEYLLLAEIEGRDITEEWEATYDTNLVQQGAIASAGLLAILANVFAYFMWIHRAHRNLPALGARELDFSPGWAIGAYFVPILNLYLPYRVMREIWKASALTYDQDSTLWRQSTTSWLLPMWWGIFLVDGIFGNIAGRFYMGAETLETTRIGAAMYAISELLTVAAAVPIMLIIWKIWHRQEDRFARLSGQTGELQDYFQTSVQ